MRVSLVKSDWRIVYGYRHLWRRLEWVGKLREADTLIGQAIGYVWGWQDAGGDPKDTQRATDFGYWYGVKVVEYLSGVRHSRGPIQDEWQGYRRAMGWIECNSLNCYETYVHLEDDGTDHHIMTFLEWRKGWRPVYGSMCFEHWVPGVDDPRYGKVK